MADLAFNHFAQIGAALHEAASQLVRKAALDIEARAKVLAPVDTGALKNSIHTEGGSNDLEKIVAVSVDYAAYVEFGTVYMAAQPYLTPAVEAVRPGFQAATKDLLDYANHLR